MAGIGAVLAAEAAETAAAGVAATGGRLLASGARVADGDANSGATMADVAPVAVEGALACPASVTTSAATAAPRTSAPLTAVTRMGPRDFGRAVDKGGGGCDTDSAGGGSLTALTGVTTALEVVTFDAEATVRMAAAEGTARR